jgi:hypothetical protein
MTKRRVGNQISKSLGRKGIAFSSMEKGAKLLSLGSKRKNCFGEQFPFGSKF